jgi:hypothetical protein
MLQKKNSDKNRSFFKQGIISLFYIFIGVWLTPFAVEIPLFFNVDYNV